MSDERQASERARFLVEMFGQLVTRARSGREELLAYVASLEADRARVDWLEGEQDREMVEIGQFSYRAPLFRRNLPITRATIDADMSSSPLAPTQEGA